MGTGSATYSGENIAAASSALVQIYDVAVDSSNGDVYIATGAGYRVQVLTRSSGLVSTFAGTGSVGFTGDGGPATAALLANADALGLYSGQLFVTEGAGGSRIRKIYSVAPTAAPTLIPSVVPPGPSLVPSEVSIMPTVSPSVLPSAFPIVNPTLLPTLVPTLQPTVRPSSARSSSFFITTVVGTGSAATTGTGGMGTAASINEPRGIWIGSTGVLYFAEYGSHCVRTLVIATNLVSNSVGVCGSTGDYSGDGGPPTAAKLSNPLSVLVNTASGVLYVCDTGNNRVRYVSASIIRNYAGSGTVDGSGDGGYASAAGLQNPVYLGIDSSERIYLIHNYDRVRRIDTTGIISLFAGTGGGGTTNDIKATSATFNKIIRMWIDSAGIVYLADTSKSLACHLITILLFFRFILDQSRVHQ